MQRLTIGAAAFLILAMVSGQGCSLSNGVFGTPHLLKDTAEHCDYCTERASLCDGQGLYARCINKTEATTCDAAAHFLGERDVRGPLISPGSGLSGSVIDAGDFPALCGGPAFYVQLIVNDDSPRHSFMSGFDATAELVDKSGDLRVIDATGEQLFAQAWEAESIVLDEGRNYSFIEATVCGDTPDEPIALRVVDHDDDVSNVLCLFGEAS